MECWHSSQKFLLKILIGGFWSDQIVGRPMRITHIDKFNKLFHFYLVFSDCWDGAAVARIDIRWEKSTFALSSSVRPVVDSGKRTESTLELNLAVAAETRS